MEVEKTNENETPATTVKRNAKLEQSPEKTTQLAIALNLLKSS